MKTFNVTHILSLSLLALFFFSCSSDSKSDDTINPVLSEIVLDKEQATLVVGEEPSIIKIVEGNGEYSAFALNSDLVNINIEKDEISLEGLKLGSTDIYLSDKYMVIKKIPVNILTSNTIVIEDNIDQANFITAKGSSEIFRLNITQGNGGYNVESDNPSLLNARIINSTVIEITTVQGNPGGEANLKVTDSFGTEKNILIIIELTDDPLTDQFIKTVKDKDVTSNELFLLSTLVNDYAFYIGDNDGNKKITIMKDVDTEDGWYSHESKVIFSYLSNLEINVPSDQASFQYDNFPEQYDSSERVTLDHFRIIEDDDASLRVVFKYTDHEDILRYGYFIYLK